MVNTAGNLDPWAVTLNIPNSIGNSTDDVRYTIGNFGQPDNSATFSWADGVYPSAMASGIVLDLRVTSTTPSPSMNVSINFGGGQVGRALHGPYQCASTTSQSVAITTANVSNPRIDYVVMRSADPGVDSSPTQSWFPVVLAGTPSATPLEPTASVQDGDLLLAAVTVRANSSSILSGDISDRRVFVASRGAPYLKSAVDNRAGAFPGMMRYNLATAAYETWNATQAAWLPVVPSSPWIDYSPRLQTYNGQTVNLGTGSFSTGRYQVQGKVCHIFMYFAWGSPPYNGGNGIIYSPLPSGIVTVNNQTQWIQCHLWNRTNADVGDWPGQAACYANNTGITPWFPWSQTNVRNAPYVIATAQGVAGTGTPYIAGGFPEGGQLTINGTFEIQ
jgi:hypothetical protein